MSQIYCGNNQHDLGPQKRLGSLYECLRKGIGRGLSADISNFNPLYTPIIPNNDYCGTDPIPPPGKVLGTPTSCLRKGVGIGMKMQFDRNWTYPPTVGTTPWLRYLGYFIAGLMVVIAKLLGVRWIYALLMGLASALLVYFVL